jgi:hypothetical protein
MLHAGEAFHDRDIMLRLSVVRHIYGPLGRAGLPRWRPLDRSRRT